MNVDHYLAELRLLRGVSLSDGAPPADIDALESEHGFRLPALHREFLERTNGVTVAGGYLRLYGVGPTAAIDMGWWNEPGTWKFAWFPHVRNFLCIGGDAFCLQIAYYRGDLAVSRQDATVYLLDPADPDAPRSTTSFGQYLEQGFLGNARKLLDAFTPKVRRRLGDLPTNELLTLAPDPVIGGPRRVRNVVRTPAVTAMVIRGDNATEFRRVTRGYTVDGRVTRVVPYSVAAGRARMRLEFEPFDARS